jgi:hypothetical protein
LGYSPIVTELSEKVLELTGDPTKQEWDDYLSRDRAAKYKLEGGTWPSCPPDSAALTAAVVEDLGVPWADIDTLIDAIRDVKSMEDMAVALAPFAHCAKDAGGLAW